MFENRRIYRSAVNHVGLQYFCVSYKETELYIGAAEDYSAEALFYIQKLRHELENYIATDEDFFKSLIPVHAKFNAPKIALDMCAAAKLAGVGPMAAVAGAFAQYVGEELLHKTPEVIVENGGDIFIATDSPRTIAVYAGTSPLSMKIGIRIPALSRMGICTSAGTIGHSLSFGKADAALIIAKNTLLADAAATTLGNAIQEPADIQDALEKIICIEGIAGAMAIIGKSMGVIGDIELADVSCS